MRRLKKIQKSSEEIVQLDEIDEKAPNTPYIIEINASPSRRFIQNFQASPALKNNALTQELVGPKAGEGKQLMPIFLKEINENIEFRHLESSIFPESITPKNRLNNEENKSKIFSKFNDDGATSPNSITKNISRGKNSEIEIIPNQKEIEEINFNKSKKVEKINFLIPQNNQNQLKNKKSNSDLNFTGNLNIEESVMIEHNKNKESIICERQEEKSSDLQQDNIERSLFNDSTKAENPIFNPLLGVSLCNELHCKEVIFFDPLQRKAFCKKCANIANTNLKDLMPISDYISTYNSKIDEIINLGTKLVEDYAFIENERSPKTFSVSEIESFFENYIKSITNIKNLIANIINSKSSSKIAKKIEDANNVLDSLGEKFIEIKRLMVSKNWIEMLNKADLNFLETSEITLNEAEGILEGYRENPNKKKFSIIKIPTNDLNHALSDFHIHLDPFDINQKSTSDWNEIKWFNNQKKYIHIIKNRFFSFCTNYRIESNFEAKIKIKKMNSKLSMAIGVSSYYFQIDYGKIGFEIGGDIISVCPNKKAGLKGKEMAKDFEFHESEEIKIVYKNCCLLFSNQNYQIEFNDEMNLPLYLCATLYSENDEIEIASICRI